MPLYTVETIIYLVETEEGTKLISDTGEVKINKGDVLEYLGKRTFKLIKKYERTD